MIKTQKPQPTQKDLGINYGISVSTVSADYFNTYSKTSLKKLCNLLYKFIGIYPSIINFVDLPPMHPEL